MPQIIVKSFETVIKQVYEKYEHILNQVLDLQTENIYAIIEYGPGLQDLNLSVEAQVNITVQEISSEMTDSSNIFTPPIVGCLRDSDVNETKPRITSRRGRPRKHQGKSRRKVIGYLWQFIIDLLRDSNSNPKLIQWVRFEHGKFRFVQPDEVARLWGIKKKNPEMNYRKLSRTMRYYYKRNIMIPYQNQSLVYQFTQSFIQKHFT